MSDSHYTATGEYLPWHTVYNPPGDPVKKEPQTEKEKHLARFAASLATMASIAAKKNADYTAGQPDPFANFRLCESHGIASVEAGILVRMTDKMARLVSLCTGHQVQVADEKLEDTLIDLANYSLILHSYLLSKKDTAHGGTDNTRLSTEDKQPEMGFDPISSYQVAFYREPYSTGE